jgi:hypothetical protein
VIVKQKKVKTCCYITTPKPSTLNRSALAPLNVPRSGLRLAVVNGAVLAVGGFDGLQVLSTVSI